MAEEQQQLKKEFVKHLLQGLQNFQSTFIINRRRRQQNYRNRRRRLCQFFVQNLLQIETQVLDMIPIMAMGTMICEKKDDENDCNEPAKNDAPPPPPVPPPSSCNLTKVYIPKYKYPRETLRFYEDVICAYPPEKWLETFRMSKNTFQALCSQLQDSMQPQGINAPLKNLISLETRCALALYAFATGADYRIIASTFRISRTSVCKFVKRFAEAVLEKLGCYLLAMPKNESEYRDIRENFQRLSNIPSLCVGLLGICEIHVSPHMDEIESYANTAGATTLLIEALIDDKLLFRKVQLDPKRPKFLLESPNEITKLGVRHIKDRFMPCFVVGPSEYYKLRPWLMQSYMDPKEAYEYNFNNAITNLQTIKKEAFRRLFGRWKILQRKGDLEPRTMESIATACCALHNLLEEYEEGYFSQWNEGVDLSRFDMMTYCEPTVSDERTSIVALNEAEEIRELLAKSMV